MSSEILQYSKLPGKLEKVQNFILKNESEHKNLEISGQNIFIENINYLDIDSCCFRKYNFTKLQGSNIKLCNTFIEDSDLSNSTFEKSLIDTADFIKCKMTGFASSNSTIRDVIFRNCKLNLSRFRFSQLKNIIFDNCVLEEADFYNATLKNVVFKKCNLIGAEFSKTNLTETDFRTSNISKMHIDIESLSGTIISYEQIIDLAWLLGATIK